MTSDNKMKRIMSLRIAVNVLAIAGVFAIAQASAQDASDEELAKQLVNPVASLISVPFQFNRDQNFGPERHGHKSYLNFQPVVPIEINGDWTVISRTIVPIVDQHIPFLGDGSQSGVADITQSFFLAPKPGPGGAIWGAGPVILIPTRSDFLSGDEWGLGPTAVILRQESGWTYGVLANHIWSVNGGAQSLSKTLVQPFLNYTTKDAWTFGINTESTYDWEHSQWTVPVNASLTKLTRIGKQPVSFGMAARYYADSPSTGPHGWGARLVVTFLFPA